MIRADATQKNKKEYKVSGKKSLPSKTFWSKSTEMRMQIAMHPKKITCTYNAGKFGEKSVCEWTFEKLQEACDKVAMKCIGRLSIAQEIFQKEH